MEHYLTKDIEADLKEWEQLRKWMLTYPVDLNDEEYNSAILNATVPKIVQAIKDRNKRLWNEIIRLQKLLNK